MKHPSMDECEKILLDYGTPDHVKGHCRAVARTAHAIGKKLNECGCHLNLPLILAAGMLHDVARVEERHGEVGAALVRRLGYEEESRIIEVHMTYSPFSDIQDVTETDMVCLADKLVMEDAYVGLDRRMEYVMAKAERNGHPEARPIILAKMKRTQRFIRQIEDRIGCTLDELMKGQL